MDSNRLQDEARAAMDVSRQEAAASREAAHVAAGAEKAAIKEKINDLKDNCTSKFNDLKEQARNGQLKDKVKDFAADTLSKGADFANELAEKLKK